MMDRRVVVGGLATSVLALSSVAATADDWPERPVRIVVPFSAGGAADTFGRFYADALSNAFGKPFYVENKVGAGGMIASEEVARAKPDGYTLVVSGIPTHVLGPAMNKNVSFDPMRDFTHIAFFGGAPNAFVVHPDFGVRSFADFMARAKGESAGIEYVSAGVGTVGNWVAEYLAAKTGIKLVHVAYKGGANAVLDLIAGHVKVGMLTYSSVSEHVRSGALLPLVVTRIGAAAATAERADVPRARLSGTGRDHVVRAVRSGRAAAGHRRAHQSRSRQRHGPAANAQADGPGCHRDQGDESAEVTQYFQSEIDKWQPIIARIMTAK